jgi:hypothetical protein
MLLAMFVVLALAVHPAGLLLLLAMLASSLVFGTFTHSVGVLYKSQEGTISNTTSSFVGNAEEGLDVSIPAATTDQPEAIAITVANLVSFCLFSALAVTVKSYAAGVLKQTITLAAGKELVWYNGSTFTNPFTNDFDTLKITNADPTKATTFKARFLLTD